MIRKATKADIEQITSIYNEIHTEEEQGRANIGWIRGIYPTQITAEKALKDSELFVLESEDRVKAAAIINQKQVPDYDKATWSEEVPDEEIMVLHTLVVSPTYSGEGNGKAFVTYYEEYAREHGCSYLRMDTNAKNKNARKMYAHLGYTEVGIVPCKFNGIQGVELVCLEKKLSEKC